MNFIYLKIILYFVKKNIRLIAFVILALFLLIPLANAQDEIIVITSDNQGDLAVASVWANKIGASLVITPWGELAKNAIDEVLLSPAEIVYVVGGKTAVPDVEGKIGNSKLIIRVGGVNRGETSLLVAERFGGKRAVLVHGYDTPSIGDAKTIGRAENIPVILVNPRDASLGTTLNELEITEATLIQNLAISDNFTDSLKISGILLNVIEKNPKDLVQKMLINVGNAISESELLVRTIREGETLAAARFIVESKILLAEAQDFYDNRNYEKSFESLAEAEQLANYASYIYNGRIKGQIEDAVSTADADILAIGVTENKENLRNQGGIYGIALPVPQSVELDSYLVDIEGYSKNIELGTGLGYSPDISATYKHTGGQNVKVEIFVQPDVNTALTWVENIVFSPGLVSEGWVRTEFMGYLANRKSRSYEVSDNSNQDVFLKVAVGELGIFASFSQSVRKSDASRLLIPIDDASSMTDEVTKEIIITVEASR